MVMETSQRCVAARSVICGYIVGLTLAFSLCNLKFIRGTARTAVLVARSPDRQSLTSV
jgi:hypothetical protein